ncbi:MAG TPA: ATP-dependent helicase HrpB, partial [Pseudomonadales bacterium]|nr:ATP-dependent helicase HrpB [Pseudomonadales bacterium]
MQPHDNVVEKTVGVVIQALDECPESSVLVFLPGQGEIARVQSSLQTALASHRLDGVKLRPLFGNLTIEEQQAAIAPSELANERKVVLATNIAETSLTIEGIDVVVDSGLAREPIYDPGTGMTRLHTRRISKASSEQRAGRAGRLRPGRCYRLWSSGQQEQLAAHGEPEILAADLTPLALQLFAWGIASPAELDWLDAPPTGAWQEAVARLTEFGALNDAQRALTPLGTAMASLPVHPRLARMMIAGASCGASDRAALLAACLSDRNPLSGTDPDLGYTMSVLTGEAACPAPQRGWLQRTRQLANQYAAQVSEISVELHIVSLAEHEILGYLIACAWPDRIARKRHGGDYLLANGRAASLADHGFSNARWLAVADVGGMARRKGDIIRSAAILDESLFESALSGRVNRQTIIEWDKRQKRFVAERRTAVGSLVLKRERLEQVPVEEKRAALIAYIRREGLGILPFKPAVRQWQARITLLRDIAPELELPDVSDANLLSTLEEWLAPYIDNVTQLADFGRLDLVSILSNLLTYEQGRTAEELLPVRIEVPSGSRYAIDYTRSPPILAVKLQEMFGAKTTPTVARGKIALSVHLLSPAGRPLQVTQDLENFWHTTYKDVKKDMKGRYPKHPWPDDPLSAVPTRHTKARQ